MRYGYLILIALLLFLPFEMRRVLIERHESSTIPADAERLVIVTPHNSDIRRAFGGAFEVWYKSHYGRDAILDFRVPGGTSDVVRFLRSKPAGIDVAWGGGDYTFYHDLQPFNLLQPIHLPPGVLRAAFPQDALAGVRLYDSTKAPDGTATPQWVGVALSSFGIIYNPQLYQVLQLPAPTTWADLTNPKLSGLVALADPSHSGSAAVAYMMVLQRSMADAEADFLSCHPLLAGIPRNAMKARTDYRAAIAEGWKHGMGQLLLIAANARYFTDSSEVVPTDVARGEAAAGMSIDFYARVTEETVGSQRARFVAPRAATAITPDSVAILKDVEGAQLSLAKRFVEFLLTPDAQRIWILEKGSAGAPLERSLRRMPIRRDVYDDQSGWADHFDPFNEAGGFNQRSEWMGLMSDVRPIWDAAWIDSRESLLDAYDAILRVSDPQRRLLLLAKLADVPVAMADIANLRNERVQIENSKGDIFDWQARQRIYWGQRFRDHYRKVASLAG